MLPSGTPPEAALILAHGLHSFPGTTGRRPPMPKFTLDFREINLSLLPEVGGKNASLGEMFRKLADQGVRVPDGFATRARAYWAFLDQAGIRLKLAAALEPLDTRAFSNLREVGEKCRSIILGANL